MVSYLKAGYLITAVEDHRETTDSTMKREHSMLNKALIIKDTQQSKDRELVHLWLQHGSYIHSLLVSFHVNNHFNTQLIYKTDTDTDILGKYYHHRLECR